MKHTKHIIQSLSNCTNNNSALVSCCEVKYEHTEQTWLKCSHSKCTLKHSLEWDKTTAC